MRYWLDTEFNGFGGELLSLSLFAEDGRSLHLIYPTPPFINDWVAENVVPILRSVPKHNSIFYRDAKYSANIDFKINAAFYIAQFLKDEDHPVIITDWPDDISYFCQAIMVGPGTMINIPALTFKLSRVDAYPTDLPGAIQHNSWWDAAALYWYLTPEKNRVEIPQ